MGLLTDILNAPLMSMEMELGGVLFSDPNTKYSYPGVLENLINYNTVIAETRPLAAGWKNDTATHCEETNPAGENTGIFART